VPVEKRAGMMDSPRRIEALLLNMLLNKQLAAQAEQMKLDHDPEVQGKTGLQRTEVLARLRLARFMKDLKVPDFEPLAHEEYLGHKDKYATPGPRTVQRIIVHTEKPGNKESEKQAWDKAEALRVEAVAAPDQFDQLVARSSDEADKASTHGIIKDVGHAKGDRWMKDALQSLHQPGDISGVVSAPGGYQVVKLLSAAPDVVPPFAAVHDQVVAQLKQNYIDSERQKFLDTLNSEKIEATPEIVASLRIRYDSPAMGAAPTSNP
jgi:peptidyl-prolyl cis-trans isomerase C